MGRASLPGALSGGPRTAVATRARLHRPPQPRSGTPPRGTTDARRWSSLESHGVLGRPASSCIRRRSTNSARWRSDRRPPGTTSHDFAISTLLPELGALDHPGAYSGGVQLARAVAIRRERELPRRPAGARSGTPGLEVPAPRASATTVTAASESCSAKLERYSIVAGSGGRNTSLPRLAVRSTAAWYTSTERCRRNSCREQLVELRRHHPRTDCQRMSTVVDAAGSASVGAARGRCLPHPTEGAERWTRCRQGLQSSTRRCRDATATAASSAHACSSRKMDGVQVERRLTDGGRLVACFDRLPLRLVVDCILPDALRGDSAVFIVSSVVGISASPLRGTSRPG